MGGSTRGWYEVKSLYVFVLSRCMEYLSELIFYENNIHGMDDGTGNEVLNRELRLC